MVDKVTKPVGQPPVANKRQDNNEQSQYPEQIDEEFREILDALAEYIVSKGKEGSPANLAGRDLSNAILQGANLNQADLHEANLSNANLSNANLEGANLERANLEGAKLERANLRGANVAVANFERRIVTKGSEPSPDLEAANLYGADLRNANLSEAKLSDVTGLRADRLGGADLSGAWIPASIETFAGLEQAAETSRNARKIWLAMLLGCVYAWLTVATTTDVRLLTNSASSPLPIIQTEIPIAWFYWAAPLILLSLYFYLHLYLQTLWQALAALPARFPDSKTIIEHAYPWLVIGLVSAYFPQLRQSRPAMSRLSNSVSIILAWWFVPVTLLVFWVRYLPRQDWMVGTRLQVACLATAAGFGLWSYIEMRRTLRHVERNFELRMLWEHWKNLSREGHWRGRSRAGYWRKMWREVRWRWRMLWLDGRTYIPFAVAAFAAVMTFLSWGSIYGVRSLTFEFDRPRTWVPYIAASAGYDVFANFREATVSTRPANFWEINESERISSMSGAELQGASLRHADALRAFLAKADLRGADLGEANLREANLNGANLESADLGGASAFEANLGGANLQNSTLERAVFTRADLTGADLRGANLEGARFGYLGSLARVSAANLAGANLFRVNLEGAKLSWVNLSGANLKGANLEGVDFEGADLSNANFEGAILRHTNLEGAMLTDAELNGAKLEEAKGLICTSLRMASNWERTYRDEECGAPIPYQPARP